VLNWLNFEAKVVVVTGGASGQGERPCTSSPEQAPPSSSRT